MKNPNLKISPYMRFLAYLVRGDSYKFHSGAYYAKHAALDFSMLMRVGSQSFHEYIGRGYRLQPSSGGVLSGENVKENARIDTVLRVFGLVRSYVVEIFDRKCGPSATGSERNVFQKYPFYEPVNAASFGGALESRGVGKVSKDDGKSKSAFGGVGADDGGQKKKVTPLVLVTKCVLFCAKLKFRIRGVKKLQKQKSSKEKVNMRRVNMEADRVQFAKLLLNNEPSLVTNSDGICRKKNFEVYGPACLDLYHCPVYRRYWEEDPYIEKRERERGKNLLSRSLTGLPTPQGRFGVSDMLRSASSGGGRSKSGGRSKRSFSY